MSRRQWGCAGVALVVVSIVGIAVTAPSDRGPPNVIRDVAPVGTAAVFIDEPTFDPAAEWLGPDLCDDVRPHGSPADTLVAPVSTKVCFQCDGPGLADHPGWCGECPALMATADEDSICSRCGRLGWCLCMPEDSLDCGIFWRDGGMAIAWKGYEIAWVDSSGVLHPPGNTQCVRCSARACYYAELCAACEGD